MSRGFTLLEVLVALAVTALVMTVGLVAVRDTARRIEQVETGLRAEWALENLRQELQFNGAPSLPPAGREEVVLGQTFVTRVETLRAGLLKLATATRDKPQVTLAETTLEIPGVANAAP